MHHPTSLEYGTEARAAVDSPVLEARVAFKGNPDAAEQISSRL
jgi:hypothetical protein